MGALVVESSFVCWTAVFSTCSSPSWTPEWGVGRRISPEESWKQVRVPGHGSLWHWSLASRGSSSSHQPGRDRNWGREGCEDKRMERNGRREREDKAPCSLLVCWTLEAPSRGCQEPHYRPVGVGGGGSLSLALSAILLFYSSISQNIFLALLECPGTSGIIVTVPDLRKFLRELPVGNSCGKRHTGNC